MARRHRGLAAPCHTHSTSPSPPPFRAPRRRHVHAQVVCDHNINISEQGIQCRWLRVIKIRLTNDKVLAIKMKRKIGFTNLVVNTWEHLLSKEGDLPNN